MTEERRDPTAPRCRHCHHVAHPGQECRRDGGCGCRRNEPLLLPGVHTLAR